MYKLFAVWTHPDDVEEFEKYYAETHAPLAAAIPGLQRLVLTRTSDFLGDGPAPFHRIARACALCLRGGGREVPLRGFEPRFPD